MSLHLLLYTGFFRLLPSRDFPYELGVGFSLELLLSVIPMLFCQVTNNAETDSDLTALQSAAMILKLASLASLMIELVMMIWEIHLNRKMHKLGLSGFKKLTEEERRRQWGKKLSSVAVVGMVVFIFILLIGVFTTDGRACGER